MSCFCDCSRENIKDNRNAPLTSSQPMKTSINTSNQNLNFDLYMTKKIAHGLPTIKESFEDEEEEYKTRKSKVGKEITKKIPILIDKNKKIQFYDFKEQLM